jgi:hypothetical protein
MITILESPTPHAVTEQAPKKSSSFSAGAMKPMFEL